MAVAKAAAALKAALDGVSSDIEQEMAVLADDKVMVLSEQQITQVSRLPVAGTASAYAEQFEASCGSCTPAQQP